MKVILLILTILTLFYGVGILGVAKSAIHEIESFLLFLISAVFFVGFAIVSALEEIRK
tara:strand:- start:159 stop:332 length:174 start_codon:yes stop_codon:yes gene_type:complete